ncbi:MAG: hypothetical protein GW947_03920 [Candidatus Pacebacteria bacterium]|nr:hypothetical protein [Candidatus Paceibacterota bacterium]
MIGFDLNDLLNQGSILLTVFKFFFIVSAALYCMFAIVVVRQVVIMKNTLLTTFSPILQIVGYAHLALAVFVLLLFFAIL